MKYPKQRDIGKELIGWLIFAFMFGAVTASTIFTIGIIVVNQILEK